MASPLHTCLYTLSLTLTTSVLRGAEIELCTRRETMETFVRQLCAVAPPSTQPPCVSECCA